jgi:hypothetical protein
MQKWLARLSFSFLIVGAILAWSAYAALRGYGRPLPEWRIVVHFLLAALCFVLGFAGIHARHRHQY